MYKKLTFSVLIYFFTVLGWANNSPTQWFTTKGKEVTLHVNVFTISTCPYCENAQAFLNDFAERNPWVELHHYEINKDKKSLITFNSFLQEQNINDFSVPAIIFCNSRWAGFKNVEQSGVQLAQGLNYCHAQVTKQGNLSESTVQTLKQMALANWYEENIKSTNSTPLFVFLMAAIDALNPTATLLILTLACFLIILPNTSLMFSILLGFILGAGFAHYFQIAYLSLFHNFMEPFRIPAILIGLGLVAFILTFLKNPINHLSRGIAAMTAFLTAFAIQSYVQLDSLPNFALIVKQWLISQQFSEVKQLIFQLIYIFIYLISLALMALLIFFLSQRTRWQKYLVQLKRLGKSLLLIIGAMLIIYPYILNNLFFIFVALVLSILLTWLLPKLNFMKENY